MTLTNNDDHNQKHSFISCRSEAFVYKLDVYESSTQDNSFYPYMSVVIGVIAAIVLCLIMTLSRHVFLRHSIFGRLRARMGVSVCVRVRARLCVCVRERERESQHVFLRHSIFGRLHAQMGVSVCVCVYVCMCVCVCVCMCV